MQNNVGIGAGHDRAITRALLQVFELSLLRAILMIKSRAQMRLYLESLVAQVHDLIGYY